MTRQHFTSRTLTGARIDSVRAKTSNTSATKKVNASEIEVKRAVRASDLMYLDRLSFEQAEAIAWEEFPDPESDPSE